MVLLRTTAGPLRDGKSETHRDRGRWELKRRVAITGMGIITSLGQGKKETWEKIRSAEAGIRPVTIFDTSGYRVHTAGEVSRVPEVQWNRFRNSRLDRGSHLIRYAFEEALREADMSPEDLPDLHPEVSIGTTLGGMAHGERYHRLVLKGGIGRGRPSLLLDQLAHAQTLHLMEEFSLPGLPVIFSNACASSANAIGHAYRSVRDGLSSVTIAGGYDPLCEFVFAGFHSLQALTEELCRPFDKERSGMVLGEGAAILLLEEFERAEGRGAAISAEILGFGESNDAFHITRPQPEGRGAAAAMRMAIDDAGIRPEDVDYINAHGTGTQPNDPMETAAIHSVFGAAGRSVPVSSVKPFFGHLLGGAGAAEAVVTLLVLKHRLLPPNLNYRTAAPDCDLNVVAGLEEAAAMEIALSNSFGFGGSNAALIFRAVRENSP